MPDVVGELIVAAVVATGEGEGFAAAAEATYFGVSGITALGSAALAATAIGLTYALNRPSVPKPGDGSSSIKQAIPPRIKGYGINRLAGYDMLYEANGSAPATAYNVLAVHSGKVDSFQHFYLNDDNVTTVADVSHGGNTTITAGFSDGRYTGGAIKIETALGNASQTAAAILTTDPVINAWWTAAHRGDGIAWIAMVCGGPSSPSVFSRTFPKGDPELSALVFCSPIWDPRDGAQSRSNPATWAFKRNPVLHLIDYMLSTDGGMGLDFATMFPAAVLAQWMVEADLCDQAVLRADGSTEPRYSCDGWYKFDNNPEDVIGQILSTCDGWMSDNGDGSQALTVGVYRAPVDPAIQARHITGFSLQYGQADEDLVNALNVSFTDPNQKYVEVELGDLRDEASIAEVGVARAKPLSLSWVQSFSQGSRLAHRALQRGNPAISGSFTTTLYGLHYLGKRWVGLQYPYIAGLEDCVIEIQDAQTDLLNGSITWTFALVNTATIESYVAATDEMPAPVVPALII